MTFYDWPEAREKARAGTPIRRYGWLDRWLINPKGKGLWWILPYAPGADATLPHRARVVRPEDFGREEFFATDWTTDAPEQNNVCERPDRPAFVPPSISFEAWFSSGGITMRAGIGEASRAGFYFVIFYLNGEEVHRATIASSGSAQVEAAADWETADAFECSALVTSALPLPAWSARQQQNLRLPPLAYETISINAAFPFVSDYDPYGLRSDWDGGEKIFGPWPTTRWIYTHDDDLAGVDDDLLINGTFINPTGVADLVYPSTTLLYVLPPNTPLRLDLWNTGGACWGEGSLRVYTRPL